MENKDILNRYSLLYGEEYPLIKELERSFNAVSKTEQFSSLFKLALEFAADDTLKPHMDTMRETLGDASSVHNIVSILVGEQKHIPNGFKNLLTRFDGPALQDAFSQGQIESKKWITDVVNELDINLGDVTYVCAGWYGLLSALLFERCGDRVNKIYSIDIDPTTENVADILNKPYVADDVRFKAIVKDIHDLEYEDDYHTVTYYKYKDLVSYEIEMDEIIVDNVNTVINTSCEHVENFDMWWDSIPDGTLVILQNNNFEEHDDSSVVNTVQSEQRWVDRVNVSELLYRGTLSLPKYKRFMVIGIK